MPNSEPPKLSLYHRSFCMFCSRVIGAIKGLDNTINYGQTQTGMLTALGTDKGIKYFWLELFRNSMPVIADSDLHVSPVFFPMALGRFSCGISSVSGLDKKVSPVSQSFNGILDKVNKNLF